MSLLNTTLGETDKKESEQQAQIHQNAPRPVIKSISPKNLTQEDLKEAHAEKETQNRKKLTSWSDEIKKVDTPKTTQQEVIEEKEITEDETLLEKLDDGLKSIDTRAEYILVTLIALLVGIIIGLIISFI